MTKFQKRMAIAGIILTAVSVTAGVIFNVRGDKKIIKVKDGVMIEQRALIGDGGGGDVTISKTITVSSNTN